MKKSRKQICVGPPEERSLCKAASLLRPLYAEAEADRPDALSHAHPDTGATVEALKIFLDVLLPGRMSSDAVRAEELGFFLVRRLSEGWNLLRPEIERAIPFRWIGAASQVKRRSRKVDPRRESYRVLQQFVDRLPEVRKLLIEDVQAAYEGDPAALTYAEVRAAYPGMLAIASHRIAHELYRLDVPIVPRIMSEWTHAQTGVDIHPGARIGRAFFIDHGTGVVIGETARIGNHVKLYQGVTLGARSFPLDAQGHPIKHIQRHPTVEDRVVIYANATILGGDTVIGRGSTVGGNVFLMCSVPPNSFVAATHPELQIKQSRKK